MTKTHFADGMHEMSTFSGRAAWYEKVAEIRVRAIARLSEPAEGVVTVPSDGWIGGERQIDVSFVGY